MSDVEIKGRSRDNAILLLAAATDLDLPASVVRTTTNGYLVPEEIAKKAGLADEDSKSEKPPAKKTAAKKATAKKTPAKKAAAKKTQE
jgi:topoisomerase IA-like protein